MSAQTANILFNVGSDKTYGNIDPTLQTKSYAIMGRATRDTLKNKTIIDESNNVAAGNLRNGSIITPLSTSSTPAIGEVLTVLGDETLGWAPAGGSMPLPLNTHAVYVMKGGDDTTGDGTLAAPYLTITHAYSTITTASTTNRFSLVVGPGRFDEPGDIVIKPWIWLIGTQRTATRVTSATNIVRLDSSFANGNYRMGCMNILFSGSTNVTFDLQTLGGSGSTVFESDAFYVNNQFTFLGRTSADFVELWNSQFLGVMTLYSLQGLLKNCYCGSNILISDLGGSENTYVDMTATYVAGNVTITQTLVNTFNSSLVGSYIGGVLNLVSTGTLNITADATLPQTVNITGVTTLTRATAATTIGYTPGNAADWVAPAPVTTQAALDRLAAIVRTLNGGNPVP